MDIPYALVRAVSVLTFIYVLKLIHDHKLRVGHSWFLFLLATGFLALSIWPDAINIMIWITGTGSWLSNILFFLTMFLFVIVVHCSLMISDLTSRVKELGQQMAILNSEVGERISQPSQGGQEARTAVPTGHPEPFSGQGWLAQEVNAKEP